MKLAPCIFTLHIDGVLEAMAAVHVDDVLCSGGEKAEQVWTELKRRLTFGSWRSMIEGFKFLGRYVRQDPDTLEIATSMADYCSELEEIAVSPSDDPERLMTPEEIGVLRSAVGKLSWTARQGRPDIIFLVSFLQQSSKEPHLKLFRMVNTAIKALKKNVELRFVRLGCDLEKVLFVVSSDGAYGTMPDGKSQQGWLVGIANPDIKEGGARMNLIEWQSTSCKRVVRSSMAIEASAASMAFEHGEYVRALFGEIMQEDFEVRRWSQFVRSWELILVLDARTAFDTLRTESLPQDRRTALDLLAIKESLLDENNRALCRWVPGPQQLADGLTKDKDNKVLSDFLATNEWTLKEDSAWQEQRTKQRENQKRYKENVRRERSSQPG